MTIFIIIRVLLLIILNMSDPITFQMPTPFWVILIPVNVV